MLRLRTGFAAAMLAAMSMLASAPASAYGGGVTLGMSRNTLISVGDGIEYGLPAAALLISAAHRDWTGAVQLGVLTAATAAVSYSLRDLIKKRAPDGSDRSFPSIPATFGSPAEHYLWRRYGWEYGVPAFFLEHLGNYWLDRAGKHKITDGLAVTVISTGLNFFITTPYHRPIRIGAAAAPDGTPMVTLAMALN